MGLGTIRRGGTVKEEQEAGGTPCTPAESGLADEIPKEAKQKQLPS